MAGAAKRMQREHTLAMSSAWHVAAFTRMKKMPDHDRIVSPRKRPERQGRAQMHAAAVQLAAAWGASPADLKTLNEGITT